MKNIIPYKLFESVSKPVKKFPTEKCIDINYLIRLLKSEGMGNIESDFQDFCFEKCSGENIIFPKIKTKYGSDIRYKKFIFNESIFLLPDSYDSSNDVNISVEKKRSFLDEMRKFAIKMLKSRDEIEKFVNDAKNNVKFDNYDYSWVNKVLEIIHNKLSRYYVDGKLKVWLNNKDDDGFEGFDYPHKFWYGEVNHSDGLYYLSDIEKYIYDKYGIKDDNFYDFIVNNDFFEGRWFERVLSLLSEEDGDKKLKKSNSTGNILHILNIIEKDFKNDIHPDNGFDLYIDYYKKID